MFKAANVGFVRHDLPITQSSTPVHDILWEANPGRFAERYPDSDIIESYGPSWDDVDCIDYWVHVEADQRLCRLSVEGWNLTEVLVRVRGNGDFDGPVIAAVFARILAVQWPPPD